MAKILDGMLPDPPVEYNHGRFNEIIKRLQIVLGLNVHTQYAADEAEAVNFFLMN